MPRKSTHHEFVTVTPEGIRYRSRTFASLSETVRWFKEHFRDAIPGIISSSDIFQLLYIVYYYAVCPSVPPSVCNDHKATAVINGLFES